MNARAIPAFLALLSAAASFAAVPPSRAADVPGSRDHPAVKRVAGSEIFFHREHDFERLKLALGKIEWNGAEAKPQPYRSATVEGKLTTCYYAAPQGMGVLEVLRNYQQELEGQGFEALFSGLGEEIETPGYNNQIAAEIYGMTGDYGTPEEKAQWPFQHTDESKAAYLAARSAAESGELYASVYVVSNTHDNWLDLPAGKTLVRLDVCEVKAREQRMELVKSEEMASEIALNGRVALYGIQFDFNSAEIKPESDATLAEIAALLQGRPDLNILVVGHTDATGSFEFNRGLSQQRAESVATTLAGKGIASSRLFPVGVSYASPVATNATEDGRAKNRRVELVDMAGGRFE